MLLAVATPSLIDRCLAGEAHAWRELHSLYYPVARRFLRRLGVDEAGTEDACQEVFVQVFRSLSEFEGRADFKTWLYRLCVTHASRARRKAHVLSALRHVTGMFRSGDDVPASGLHAVGAEAQEIVRSALRKVKPIYTVPFVLFELEGLSGQEIAGILGCPVATVWRRLHEARKQLQRLVEPDGEEGHA
jgi:RNA polymerase sigma-70 factor (ECF subfamily)